ncbi:protein FAM170A isoform X1 [Sorex fumeus]|uniref:protein FAM170A isoform X1 n=1 Tax=Sorex fumeus TaxID=62283 RepID=UPI0024AE816D|nr:protein FAM170A isoform X1 [Sorex fumeus]
MKRRQKRKHLENEESQESADWGGGIFTSPEEASQRGSSGVAKGWNLGVREVSSISEYFSCVSFPRKFLHGGIWRLHHDSSQHRSPLSQVHEEWETAPHSQHISFLSPSSYKTCISSLYVNKEESGMKIYYMKVQMQNGVAVSWETEETSMFVEKLPRMEEGTIPEDVGVGNTPSDVSTRNLLSDSEPSGEEKEHEERTESDSLPGSPDVEERPRAKTPDWLVTVDTGFRCMACCRVFSTLEILQEHVQYGIREGFSCHIFHLTMARLTGTVESESMQEEEEGDGIEDEDEENKEKAKEEKSQEKENDEEPPTGNTLGLKRPLSQCPGCVFHSSEDRK